MNSSNIQISPQQIMASANAGVDLINRDSTLIPGSLRLQVNVLEVILQGLAQGRFILVSPPPVEVQSDSEGGDAKRPPLIDAELNINKLAAVARRMNSDTKPVDAVNDVTDIGAKTNGGPSEKS